MNPLAQQNNGSTFKNSSMVTIGVGGLIVMMLMSNLRRPATVVERVPRAASVQPRFRDPDVEEVPQVASRKTMGRGFEKAVEDMHEKRERNAKIAKDAENTAYPSVERVVTSKPITPVPVSKSVIEEKPGIFTGTWNVRGDTLPAFHLKQVDDSISGSYAMKYKLKMFPFKGGTVEGNVATFKIVDGVQTVWYEMKIVSSGLQAEVRSWVSPEDLPRMIEAAKRHIVGGTKAQRMAKYAEIERQIINAGKRRLVGVFVRVSDDQAKTARK